MGWVVNATPRPLYHREGSSTHCMGGWVGPRAGLAAENLAPPTGSRFPYHPARSESLYRLRCPGPYGIKSTFLILCVVRWFPFAFPLRITPTTVTTFIAHRSWWNPQHRCQPLPTADSHTISCVSHSALGDEV
jgi:hypothetical protein